MEYYTVHFSDNKIVIDRDNLIRIPYFKNSIDSGLQESITKEFKLLEYKYKGFVNIYNYLITGKIHKNSLNKEEISLCDYLNYDAYIEKSIMMCSKSYLIDNTIYTRDEIVLNDFVNYRDRLIFNHKEDFDTYLENMDAFDLEKTGKLGFIHILTWYNKHYKINFESILDKIDVIVQDSDGWTALMFALRYSNTTTTKNTVRMLLEHPNIDVNVRNNDGWTALMCASRYSNSGSYKTIMKMLLEHPTIDVNLQNKDGFTALICASRFSNTTSSEHTVRMLLEHPTIDVNLQSVNGFTALMCASRFSNTTSNENTVRMLLEHPTIDVNLQNHMGWTALKSASRFSYTTSTENTVSMLFEHPSNDFIACRIESVNCSCLRCYCWCWRWHCLC